MLNASILATVENARTSDLACWRPPASSIRLVSFRHMLRVHADDFKKLLMVLGRVQVFLEYGPRQLADGIADGNADGMARIVWEQIQPLLNEIDDICIRLELKFVREKLARMREGIDDSASHQSIANAIKELAERVEDQFKHRVIFFVPFGRVKYLPSSNPLFGDLVQSSFPEMTADIEDAGFCLCFGRWTAAVYHLMRVMEFALNRLGKKLKIPQKEIQGKTWGEILNRIDTAIGGMKKRTGRHELYSETAAHLRHVKNAWRDPTMHNRRRYNEDEAAAIFAGVNNFVKSLGIAIRPRTQ